MPAWTKASDPPPPGELVKVRLRSGREDLGWLEDPDLAVDEDPNWTDRSTQWVQAADGELFDPDDPPEAWYSLVAES